MPFHSQPHILRRSFCSSPHKRERLLQPVRRCVHTIISDVGRCRVVKPLMKQTVSRDDQQDEATASASFFSTFYNQAHPFIHSSRSLHTPSLTNSDAVQLLRASRFIADASLPDYAFERVFTSRTVGELKRCVVLCERYR